MSLSHRRAAALVVLTGLGCAGPHGDGASADTARADAPEGDAGVTETTADTAEPLVPPALETRPATCLALAGMSVNGRVNAHGRPARWWFELGDTEAYGRTSPSAPLPPRVGAYYHEAWDRGVAGWAGGVDGLKLEHHPSGGVGGSGFVRYTFPGPIDAAHADGIGANSLLQYVYPGAWETAPVYAALGGGDPDFRGARVSVYVRGNDFVQNGSELVFWAQSTPNLVESYDDRTARWSNWLHSGDDLTELLFSGGWEEGAYTLHADTERWTYAGHYVATGRETYVYVPLDQVLGHLNGDIFHMQVFFEFHLEPRGAIDFDELVIAYPNHSLLWPPHGGALVSSPASDDDPARLTDGWRHGVAHGFSAPWTEAPLELVYRLAAPATLTAVQLHQHPEWPAREVEVLASLDGEQLDVLARGEMPASHPEGDNFAYFLYDPVRAAAKVVDGAPVLPWRTAPAGWLKVRVLGGHRPERAGLGEIELFGEGVAKATENDWVSVTSDFTGLSRGTTYHYRLVVETYDRVVTHGPDATFTVPATALPLVTTQPVSRLSDGGAKVEGRVCPLGERTNYWFEVAAATPGDEPCAGAVFERRTVERYVGLEPTPRTVTDELFDLAPGVSYCVRLVAVNDVGTTSGAPVTFVAR